MNWQRHFSNYATSTAFSMQISKHQCALLCSINDGSWRSWWSEGPRNYFYSAFIALEAKGLVERNEPHYRDANWNGWRYRLTPAGEAVMVLLKLAGVVPELDAANSQVA